MNKQLLTGLTIIGVAGSAGAAYAGVSVINSASAQNIPATSATGSQAQPPVTRTVVYQVGAAGQVTLAVTGEHLAVNGSAAAAGWTVGGASATGRHAEVQFTDGAQLVTFLADLVDGEIVVSVTNVVAGASAPQGVDVSVLSDSGTPLPLPAMTPPTTPAGANPGHAGTTAPSSGVDDDDDDDDDDEDEDHEDDDDDHEEDDEEDDD